MAMSLSRGLSFWLLALLLALFLFAASAPSPLYAIYAQLWHFSPATLTAIYAVYAFGALAALLVTGRLSDHLGRRPVVTGALVVQIAGMAAFIAADGESALYIGRALQGFATGAASAAISAWLLDLQPATGASLGSLVGGVAPVAGLGAGALGSGLLVQYAPQPLRLVFWVLLVVFGVALGAVSLMPDEVRRTPGWLASMRPRVAVPAAARPVFVALVPSLVATWALSGLYLSLGPSLAASLLRNDDRVLGGLVIFALMGVGAAASVVARAADPRRAVTYGSLALTAGVAVTLLGVALDSIVGLYAGSVIAGIGVGPVFSGVFRSLTRLAPPEQRGALVAAIYVAVYLSFSVPAIIAGTAVTRYGLRDTTYAYGAAVMALAATTAVTVMRQKVAARAA